MTERAAGYVPTSDPDEIVKDSHYNEAFDSSLGFPKEKNSGTLELGFQPTDIDVDEDQDDHVAFIDKEVVAYEPMNTTDKEPQKEKPKGGHIYRPDIDGLRTIAVSAVVIFHFFPDLWPGGFVGVDMFFVISGYLISGIISRRVAKGTFTYADFYSKRIRRIFPTLIVVLIPTVIFGAIYLPQASFEVMGSSMAWGCAFAANIRYAAFGTSADNGDGGTYWQATETQKVQNGNPYVHLWSLGVEEQFYILWPVIVPFIIRRKSIVVQGLMFAILFFVSMAANLGMGYAGMESLAYYLVITRFWELLIGCILAWAPWEWVKDFNKRPAWASEVLSVAGVILILIAIAKTTKKMMFPGYIALLPTIGTALVMMAGPETKINKYFIGNAVFAWIGRVSYPVYVWHWPIMIYGRLIAVESDRHPDEPWLPFCEDKETTDTLFPPWMRLLLIALTLVLSTITLYFVEKPLRMHKSYWMPLYLGSTVFILFILGVLIGAGQVDVIDRPTNTGSSLDLAPYRISVSKSTDPYHMLDECIANLNPERVTHNSGIPEEGITRLDFTGRLPGKVVFWGDSHMWANTPRIKYLYGEGNRSADMPSARVFYKPGDPPFPSILGPMSMHINDVDQFKDFAMAKEIERYIDEPKNGVTAVVFLGFYELYLSVATFANGMPYAWPRTLDELAHSDEWPAMTKAFLEKWQQYIQSLTDSGKMVYVVKPHPTHYDMWNVGRQIMCPGHHHKTPPSFFVSGENARCAECGPKLMVSSDRLVDNVDKHLVPYSIEEYYNTTSFVADPLLQYAEVGGAILLDPTSTLCHDGLCPLIDPSGRPTFEDLDHLRATYTEVYGGYLDEPFGITSPPPNEYCLPK